MICTFYSFKGGAGRSMALANVAKWYTMQGLSVTMVDWDLEAPGLESFFFEEKSDLDDAASQLGLIDMLGAYKRRFRALQSQRGAAERPLTDVLDDHLPALETLLYTLPSGSAPLRLLTAGWRTHERLHAYGTAVQSFDWNDFYDHFEGEAYFEWFRRKLRESADVVLIDSRTGFTEMGGVCTRQLADVVVSLCAPNQQSLDGVTTMSASFKDGRLIERRRRDLDVVIVPTRIDFSEVQARNRFEQLFREATSAFTPVPFKTYGRDFWQLRIPYVPLYAYGERLAVDAGQTVEELVSAYQHLAAHIALLAPGDSTALHAIWEKFWRSAAPQPPTAVATAFGAPARASRFTGRETLLLELEHWIGSRNQLALTGLAGAGKTALAVEYAYRKRGEYDVVWVLDAGSAETLAASWGDLAASLSLVPTAQTPPEQVVQQWLERNSRWLLIFDGAEDRDRVRVHVPRSPTGQVLITSRDATWAALAPALEVGALSTDDATALIQARVGHLGEPSEAAELARRVGCLPAALETVLTHVQTSGRPLRDLVRLIDGDPARTLGSAASAVSDCLADVERASPVAAQLVALCAHLGEGPIPLESLLTASPVVPEGLQATVRDPFSLDGTLVALRRRSLAEMDAEGLHLHAVVRLASRMRLSASEQDFWATTAAIAAARGTAEDHRLLSHAAAALDHLVRDRGIDSATSPQLDQELALALDALGLRLEDAAQPEAALSAAQEAVARWRRLATDAPAGFAPDLALSLDTLATRLADAGRAADALGWAEEAVAIWRELVARGTWQHRAPLAIALTALAERLASVGASEDALKAALEAVAIWAALSETPQEQLADKAASLSVLAQRLAELGSYEQSLQPANEATALWRQVAELRPVDVGAEPCMPTSDAAAVFSTLGVQAARRRRQVVGFLVVDGKKTLPLHYVHHRGTMPGHSSDRFRALLRIGYAEFDALVEGRLGRDAYVSLLTERTVAGVEAPPVLRAEQ